MTPALEAAELPADAIEVYRGPAENSDFLLKYVTVKSYDG